MSTSLLDHTCGIRGYEHRSTEHLCGTTFFRIEQPRRKLRCPRCGSAEVIVRESVPRVFRSVPIGCKPVSIALDVPRVQCTKCGITRQVRVAFADERRRHTRTFARYALELTRLATIQDVAHHLGVGWDRGDNDIQEERLIAEQGRIRLAQGRADEAFELVTSAIKQMEAAGKGESLPAGNAHGILGDVFLARGDLSGARKEWEFALRIRLRDFVPTHPSSQRLSKKIADLDAAETTSSS